jgi:uncharacterized protein
MEEMKKDIQKVIQKYDTLRFEVENECAQLHKGHQQHTKCAKGCSDCCMNFNLLPVEFYSILNNIKSSQLILSECVNNETCPFLYEGLCQIYDYRPLICRSHGLPILTMDTEGENWELSFCPLNFTKADDDYFDNENCYEQDRFNSKLYLLNLEFIEHWEGVNLTDQTMYDLEELARQCKKSF